MVVDDNGKKMKAIDVIAAVIKYFKDHLLELMEKRGTMLQANDISWVLPVPAIWTDTAKQIMREAAYQAEIKNTTLTIVSEPEAASLYCQMCPDKMCIRDLADNAQWSSRPGIKFMVIDLGGFLANFTIFERGSDGGVIEVKTATAVACGSNMVKNDYNGLIQSIVGGEIYNKWVDENPEDTLVLQDEFDVKLRGLKHGSGKQTLKVPVSIACYFKEQNHETIQHAVERSQFKGKVTWLSDKIRIDADVIKDLYKPCTDKIVGHIKDLLKEQDARDTRTLLMIVTLAESTIVQETITRFFPNYNVIIPMVPDVVVMEGAVIYGHQH